MNLPDIQVLLYETTRELVRSHLEDNKKNREAELKELCAIIGEDPDVFFRNVMAEPRIELDE